MTNPLASGDAQDVNGVERTIEYVEDAQAKLKSGQMNQGDYDKIISETTQKVEEIAAKHPQSAPVLTSVARAYIQIGDYDKAVARASQAMALAPNDPFPMVTRGLAYFEAKNFPLAAQDAQRALSVAPKDPVAWSIFMLSKGRAPGGSSAGVPGDIVGAGRQSLSLPENPYAAKPPALRPGDDSEIARYKTEVGRDYARQVIAVEKAVQRKDYLTAFGLANKALTTYADNPRVLAARAVSAWNLHDTRTTISDATLVLKADPTMHPMLSARAAAYNDMSRYADALRDAEKAVALAPRSAVALLERAIAKEGLRDPPESTLADFKRAAELDPKFTLNYKQALSRLMGQAGQGTVETAGRNSSRTSRGARDFLGTITARASGVSWPEAALGLVGLLGLATAGLLLRSRD